MSEKQMQYSREFETIPNIPLLNKVTYPVIEIRDRKIRVILDDVDGNEMELNFQPYQALKLTTNDCFLTPIESGYVHGRVLYQRTSAWLDDLKSALLVIDESANFMKQALHFTIPAGDDVLEVVAWKIEIKYLNKHLTFPENVKMPPF